ncbi:MAG: phosphate uptake regulator PhoU, partial [Nitrospiraceae bacterium]
MLNTLGPDYGGHSRADRHIIQPGDVLITGAPGVIDGFTTELERIGDQAVNMCEYVELLISEPELKPLIDLPRMAELSRGMVRDALRAFNERDAARARETLKTDDMVDAMNDQIFRELLTYTMTAPENITRAMALILTARSLERIADHATNIC